MQSSLTYKSNTNALKVFFENQKLLNCSKHLYKNVGLVVILWKLFAETAM